LEALVDSVEIILEEEYAVDPEEGVVVLLTDVACEFEDGSSLEYELYRGSFVSKSKIRLLNAGGEILNKRIRSKSPEYLMGKAQIWLGTNRLVIDGGQDVAEITLETPELMEPNLDYPSQLAEVPGAAGYVGPDYVLGRNGEDPVKIYWVERTIEFSARVPDDKFEQGIEIAAYTHDNGQYDVLSTKRGKIQFYITYFELEKVEHLIGREVAIVVDGYDKGERFLLTENLFEEGKFYLKKSQIGLSVSRGGSAS
jgi:hypothetical protein